MVPCRGAAALQTPSVSREGSWPAPPPHRGQILCKEVSGSPRIPEPGSPHPSGGQQHPGPAEMSPPASSSPPLRTACPPQLRTELQPPPQQPPLAAPCRARGAPRAPCLHPGGGGQHPASCQAQPRGRAATERVRSRASHLGWCGRPCSLPTTRNTARGKQGSWPPCRRGACSRDRLPAAVPGSACTPSAALCACFCRGCPAGSASAGTPGSPSSWPGWKRPRSVRTENFGRQGLKPAGEKPHEHSLQPGTAGTEHTGATRDPTAPSPWHHRAVPQGTAPPWR